MEQEFQIDDETYTAVVASRHDRRVVTVANAQGKPLWEDHTLLDAGTAVGPWRKWGIQADEMLIIDAIDEFKRRIAKLD